MKSVVSISGGKDSTAMLLLLLEKDVHIDYVVFCNTSKEFPETYAHIEKMKEKLPIEIVTVSFDFDYYFSKHVISKGRNKGKIGYGWPSSRYRWCAGQKIKALNNFVDSLNDKIISYIGYSADEVRRSINHVKYRPDIEYRFPLIDICMSSQAALDYCKWNGFDFNGLYNKMSRAACYCCPLASLKNLNTIYCDYPELWDKMRKMDAISPNEFNPRYSLSDLERRFKNDSCRI